MLKVFSSSTDRSLLYKELKKPHQTAPTPWTISFVFFHKNEIGYENFLMHKFGCLVLWERIPPHMLTAASRHWF